MGRGKWGGGNVNARMFLGPRISLRELDDRYKPGISQSVDILWLIVLVHPKHSPMGSSSRVSYVAISSETKKKKRSFVYLTQAFAYLFEIQIIRTSCTPHTKNNNNKKKTNVGWVECAAINHSAMQFYLLWTPVPLRANNGIDGNSRMSLIMKKCFRCCVEPNDLQPVASRLCHVSKSGRSFCTCCLEIERDLVVVMAFWGLEIKCICNEAFL